MKKTIALIISVILVVSIFASCTPATENTATIDEKAETNLIDTKAASEENLDGESEENIVPGFYLEGKMDQPLAVGSEVPRNSRLAYLIEDGKIRYFFVHDTNKLICMNNWYGSGDTAYTVKEIDFLGDDPVIYLSKPETTPGLYIVSSKQGEPAGTKLQIGMILYKNTEVAYLDKQKNKKAFRITDGNGNSANIQNNETYNTGNSDWKVQSIQLAPDSYVKAFVEFTCP